MHKSLTQISRLIMLVLDGDSLSQYTEYNKGAIQHYLRDWGTDHKMGTLETTLLAHLAASTQFSRRNLLRQFSARTFSFSNDNDNPETSFGENFL